MTDCTLCGLPTPDPPVTGEAVEGQFCCRGCLEVSRTLTDPAEADPATVQTALEDQDQAFTESGGNGAITYLAVDGMHCATCEVFLENEGTGVSGVLGVEASYAAELLRVEYDPTETNPETLATKLSGLGYEVYPIESDPPDTDDTTASRLLVGVIFGFMTMMWYVLFLYPTYLGVAPESLLLNVTGPAGTYVLWTVMVLSTVVLAYTGAPLLRGAWVSLKTRQPNMDLLIALAAGTAYTYSLIALLVGRTELYFDVAVVVIVVVSIGRYYEDRVRDRAGEALADLAEARVQEARRQTASGPETVPIEALRQSDSVVVRAGERIPVDGTITDGSAAVDESLVTGEARPVRRSVGDEVLGGTIATDGRLVIEPDTEDTSTVDRLVEVLWDVQSRSGGAQRLADRLARVFVPTVILVAIVAGLVHIGLGSPPTAALLTALAVLVVSCPCALGLATPLAIARGVRTALAAGVVLTDRGAIERVAATDIIAIDKTGTLTTGGMRVEAVVGQETALRMAAAIEQYATHPIATAIVDAADDVPSGQDYENHPGLGASGTVEGRDVLVGREALLQERDVTISPDLEDRYERAIENGHAPTFVAWDGAARAVIVASGERREEWRDVVSELSGLSERIVILTGDTPAAAEPMRRHEAVDDVFADVPPEGKAAVIEQLGERGTVAMVGDGTNDAPALAAADVGIALGSGTDLAADAADAVVVSDNLADVPRVFELTAATRRRIRENLAWAFLYNLVAIPLAALGLLNPLFAAVAMAGSSLLVVANSSRELGGIASEEPTLATDAGSNTVPADGGSHA